jgi:elongation factor Ts
MKAVVVETAGGEPEIAGNAGRQTAIQSVAFPPEFIKKDEIPQAHIDAEMEVETQRAINEGKPKEIAENIARGRINKEYVKRVVLLEQPYYKDPNRSVSQYLAEEAKGVDIARLIRLAVGEGS